MGYAVMETDKKESNWPSNVQSIIYFETEFKNFGDSFKLIQENDILELIQEIYQNNSPELSNLLFMTIFHKLTKNANQSQKI